MLVVGYTVLFEFLWFILALPPEISPSADESSDNETLVVILAS